MTKAAAATTSAPGLAGRRRGISRSRTRSRPSARSQRRRFPRRGGRRGRQLWLKKERQKRQACSEGQIASPRATPRAFSPSSRRSRHPLPHLLRPSRRRSGCRLRTQRRGASEIRQRPAPPRGAPRLGARCGERHRSFLVLLPRLPPSARTARSAPGSRRQRRRGGVFCCCSREMKRVQKPGRGRFRRARGAPASRGGRARRRARPRRGQEVVSTLLVLLWRRLLAFPCREQHARLPAPLRKKRRGARRRRPGAGSRAAEPGPLGSPSNSRLLLLRLLLPRLPAPTRPAAEAAAPCRLAQGAQSRRKSESR